MERNGFRNVKYLSNWSLIVACSSHTAETIWVLCRSVCIASATVGCWTEFVSANVTAMLINLLFIYWLRAHHANYGERCCCERLQSYLMRRAWNIRPDAFFRYKKYERKLNRCSCGDFINFNEQKWARERERKSFLKFYFHKIVYFRRNDQSCLRFAYFCKWMHPNDDERDGKRRHNSIYLLYVDAIDSCCWTWKCKYRTLTHLPLSFTTEVACAYRFGMKSFFCIFIFLI